MVKKMSDKKYIFRIFDRQDGFFRIFVEFINCPKFYGGDFVNLRKNSKSNGSRDNIQNISI